MYRPSRTVSMVIAFVLYGTAVERAIAAEGGSATPGAPVAAAGRGLADGFLNPPPSARPAAYWAWLNGSVSLPQLTRELAEMKDKGISKLYIFECGAKDPDGVIPAGPAFMGPESVKAIGYAIREAARLEMELGLTTSSSWNAGGSWVTPQHASMGLFRSETTVEGPVRFDEELPFPSVPAKAPKRPDGLPAYYQDVAVLAVPEPEPLAEYEFVFELAPPGPHVVDRVVLYNTPSEDAARYGKMHLFAKDFSVAVSATTPDAEAFKEVVRGTLKPAADAQEFRFPPVEARNVKLRILSGHNPEYDKIQLGEFELYNLEGENVALAYRPDGSGRNANLLRYTSALRQKGDWAASNIHDGATSGAHGSWCSGPRAIVIRDPSSIVDLTDHLDAGGRLTWDVPPGDWVIMRFVCTNTGQGLAIPSPNSQGLAIDHFSAEATRMHFQYFIDNLQKEVGPLDSTALTTMYLCSYELRGAAWTPDFLDEFKSRRGYKMTRYLPVLFGSRVASQQVTERFLYDFRKTQGDLLVDAFYKTAAEICHEHGLLLCAEAGGPGPPTHNVPVDALKALGVLDIPRGEFWTDLHLWVVKETACAAHVYGKRVVDMESFTSWRHWQDGPFELKPFADRAMCGGTNHFTFHTSPHNPPEAGLPGRVYHAGTHMGANLAWWPKAGPFIDYLARCSYLLQQGLFVGDVCYYYGDQAYNFVPPKHVDPSLGSGYDYDVVNAEVILTRMDVDGGRIVLPDGLSYPLLVLPEREDIDLAVLQKLEQLVTAGATVVGRKPTRSNGLAEYQERDRQVKHLADRLWGPCDGNRIKEHPYGNGKIIWGHSLREILQDRGIGPDFTFLGRDRETSLDYIHRRAGSDDIYFVRNANLREEEVDCVFRAGGKVPELWMPDTGQIRTQLVYRSVEGGTKVPLRLPPAGSVFVVFRRPAPQNHLVAVSKDGIRLFPGSAETLPKRACVDVVPGTDGGLELRATQGGTYVLETAQGRRLTVEVKPPPTPREITGPWQVRFPKGWGAPASAVFPNLISWTQHPQDGIKYFSGIATYEKQFELPAALLEEGNRVLLDLGRVKFVADVYLNGKRLGILWKPPFRLDVTDAARPGKNRLVVEVANVWSNRLVGDARSPEGARYCRTNMKRSQTRKVPWKETPLLESGLLGPVRLHLVRTVAVGL